MPDVDVIITIGGKNVSKDVATWSVKDAEEGASEISVKLKSRNLEHADAFDYLQDMEIRFGTPQDMSDTATLPVDSIEPEFGTKDYDTVTIVARDPSRHLAGGKHRGKCKTDKVEDILKDELQSVGLEGKIDVSGTAKLKKPALMNENSRQFLWRMMRYSKPKSGKSGGPSNPMSDDKGGQGGGNIERNQGNSWSSAAGMHEPGRDYDDYRGKDDNHRHGSEPLTATLSLKGYPKLKAKTCIQVGGYGSKWSGVWYVKEVTHKGGTEAFTTEAHLIRGGTGSGGVGGNPPIVMYAELYQKGTVFIGHRKIDQSPAHTFTRGDKKIIKFKPKLNPQPQRGAGEPKKGKGLGLNLRDELKEFETGPAGGGS